MSVKVMSIGLKGLEGYIIQVEVQVTEALESIVIVGLPDASVKESKERVSAALYSLGFPLVDKKVIINLSPAEQKKNGPLFDLPIAIGILRGVQFIKKDIPSFYGFIGALSLDGAIVPVEGMIAAILAAKKLKLKRLFLPYDPALPKLEMEGLELVYVQCIQDVTSILSGQPIFPLVEQPIVLEETVSSKRDFNQIIGHSFAKRALEIAASGEHYLLMDGPPGCGKSLLAETFPSILPPLSKEAQLEKLSLYQLAGAPYSSLVQPPYRHPHHSASAVSIIGGGTNPKPGEVSLAHHGVLFLDELGEFSKKTLDMLRQPLENQRVTISRVHSTVTYPAKFIFIAAMNPCPCGYLGSPDHYCSCTEKQVKLYKSRVSGPILDRIDILLTLHPVPLKDSHFDRIESSETVRNRIIEARDRQRKRYGREVTNASVSLEELLTKSPLSTSQRQFIQELSSAEGYSNRVQIKLIRLSRTISDINGSDSITDEAIIEALSLRKVSRATIHSYYKQSLTNQRQETIPYVNEKG
ncbi:magnesium chelatase [Bacillus coahuilensis m2-6]|uniref:YifB family Mg chelatase-like AAA ATPase n=1 Tax=Bacillus coahuilensis TaxID=408580 RepID=UPI0007500DE3|nr:YifB family Mg chelatase-like AAA ATPase [Bacillus coahuilensis]KUP05308.1 magnesium chelatase [Bacillus coahuilensis m2-6]